MPMYEHRCFDCGHSFEEFRSMHDDAPTSCAECGSGDLRQVLGTPMIVPDIAPYQSIVTGETITSRARHREHLKRHDLVEVGNEMPKSLREFRDSQAQRGDER